MAVSSIGDILRATLPEQGWQAKLLSQWPHIVGPLHEQMRIEKVQRDCLVIGVYDPHWMHELFMLAPTILEAIQNNFGETPITNLRFICVQKKETVTQAKTAATPQKKEKKQLSPHHEQVLTRVQSNELKSALRTFFANCVT